MLYLSSMKKNKELHQAFLSDFKALLKKYDASFDVEFRGTGWDFKYVPVIDFNGIYEGESQREYSQFELPDYIDTK